MATNIQGLGSLARCFEKKYGTEEASKLVRLVKKLAAFSVDIHEQTKSKPVPKMGEGKMTRREFARSVSVCQKCQKEAKKECDGCSKYYAIKYGYARQNLSQEARKKLISELCQECGFIVTKFCAPHFAVSHSL